MSYDLRKQRVSRRTFDTEEGEGMPERVDDGDATALASTPADEGFEADDTSRSMASAEEKRGWWGNKERARRRGAHDEERVEDDALVSQHDDRTPAFAE